MGKLKPHSPLPWSVAIDEQTGWIFIKSAKKKNGLSDRVAVFPAAFSEKEILANATFIVSQVNRREASDEG